MSMATVCTVRVFSDLHISGPQLSSESKGKRMLLSSWWNFWYKKQGCV